MKKFSVFHHLLLTGWIIRSMFFAIPAYAQNAIKVQELQRVIEAQQKHLRLAGNLRDLRAEGADGSTDLALGWVVAGSAKVRLPFLGEKDNFKFTVHYGDGYGTRIKGGPKEGAFNTATSELETIGVFGTFGGIQHFWSEKFRSNLVYGYVNADNPGFLSGDNFDNTNYVAADLIWNPYKQLNLGVEYLWGRRENKDGASGTDNRFLFSTRHNF